MTVTGLHHASLTVTDLERSLRFYRDLLGVSVREQVDTAAALVTAISGESTGRVRIADLDLGDGRVLELVEDRDHEPQTHAGSHIAFEVDDVWATYRRLVDALHGADLAAVPDLHRDQARFGDIDGGELIERHRVAIGHDYDRVEQTRRGAPRTQAAELLFQHAESATHPPLDLLQVEARHVAFPASSFPRHPPAEFGPSSVRQSRRAKGASLGFHRLWWSRSPSLATREPSHLGS